MTPHTPNGTTGSDPATAARRQAERLREQMSILVDFARVVSDTHDVSRLLDLACRHAARGTQVARTKVLCYRADKGDLLMVAGVGWKPGLVGHARLAIDMASPPGRCWQTGQVVSCGDLLAGPGFRREGMLKDEGIVSMLNAPVTVDGHAWGVIEADSTERDAFDEDDERFMVALAGTQALAMGLREAKAQRERDAEEAGRRVAQIETLIAEQNHRVRNYFQMIQSILGSRSMRVTDAQTRADYGEVMERVAAIALAHDLLRIERGYSIIDAATYLDALCGSIERTLRGELNIKRDLEALPMRPDRAVPLGLAVNELITNAIKHAFKDRPGGNLEIALRVDDARHQATLEVRDDGPGMGESRPGSMGLRLVRALTSQLGGRIALDSGPGGTRVTLSFPVVD